MQFARNVCLCLSSHHEAVSRSDRAAEEKSGNCLPLMFSEGTASVMIAVRSEYRSHHLQVRSEDLTM